MRLWIHMSGLHRRVSLSEKAQIQKSSMLTCISYRSKFIQRKYLGRIYILQLLSVHASNFQHLRRATSVVFENDILQLYRFFLLYDSSKPLFCLDNLCPNTLWFILMPLIVASVALRKWQVSFDAQCIWYAWFLRTGNGSVELSQCS